MDPEVATISKQTEIPVSEIPSSKPHHPFRKMPVLVIAFFLVLVIAAFFAGAYYQGMNTKKDAAKIAVVSPTPLQPTPTNDPTADWKRYTSEEYHYTFKYPANAVLTTLQYIGDKEKDEKGVAVNLDGGKLEIIPNAGGMGLNPVKSYGVTIGGVETTKYYITEDRGVYSAISSPERSNEIFFNFQLPKNAQAASVDKSFDEILSSFAFTGSGDEVGWKAQLFPEYPLALDVPYNWSSREVSRRPEPTGPADPVTGHDCVDYQVENPDKTALLSFIQVCGYADGGGDEAPANSVVVGALPNNSQIIRFYDASAKMYHYVTAGVVEFTDETGKKSNKLMQDNVLSFMTGERTLFLRVQLRLKGSDAENKKNLSYADKAISTLRK